MLILAGVTIATLTGDNGIITRANQAKEETEEAEKEEKNDLEKQADFINEYTNGIEVEQVTDENPGVLETEGTDTYIINSIEDLVFFADDVTNGNTYEGQTVKLGLSLDFNSTKSYVDPLRTDYGQYGYDGELKTLLTTGGGFKSIGTNYDANINTNYFYGTFDGNNNVIYNLYQNYENSEYTSIIGFFSTSEGVIENLIIENANISSVTNNMHIVSGILVGRNKGSIINCGVSGNSKVTDNGVKSIYCSGITGQSMGSIEKCYSKANIEVSSNNSSEIRVGGITGALTEEYIQYCYNIGNITIDLNADIQIAVGGIAGGNNNKEISNCYNVGDINLNASCETTHKIFVGSVVGQSLEESSKMINCFNIGEMNIGVLNDTDETCIGNIVGILHLGTMDNCYNKGKMNLTDVKVQRVGQIAGMIHTATVNNCYGLIGQIEVIGNHYNSTLNNVKLVEENEMPDILQVLGENFKADTNNINNGYPILNWQ